MVRSQETGACAGLYGVHLMVNDEKCLLSRVLFFPKIRAQKFWGQFRVFSV